jgi:hypothetical protein
MNERLLEACVAFFQKLAFVCHYIVLATLDQLAALRPIDFLLKRVDGVCDRLIDGGHLLLCERHGGGWWWCLDGR